MMKRTKTMKNKLYALALMGAGVIPVLIERDATALIFFGSIALPLFFAKEDWIV